MKSAFTEFVEYHKEALNRLLLEKKKYTNKQNIPLAINRQTSGNPTKYIHINITHIMSSILQILFTKQIYFYHSRTLNHFT